MSSNDFININQIVRDFMEKRICDPDYLQTPKKRHSFGCLYPGAKFSGRQLGNITLNSLDFQVFRYDDNLHRSYEVDIQIKNVDIESYEIAGFLTIFKLTDQYPEITTYFDGEIIGPKYGFYTGKWDADRSTDLLHWRQLPGTEKYINEDRILGSPNPFSLRNNDKNNKQDGNGNGNENMNEKENIDEIENEKNKKDEPDKYIYMRWKELFLVPDHRVKELNGATYSGFYYVCLDPSLNGGHIDGFYYASNSQSAMQIISLNYVPNRKFPSFEFR